VPLRAVEALPLPCSLLLPKCLVQVRTDASMAVVEWACMEEEVLAFSSLVLMERGRVKRTRPSRKREWKNFVRKFSHLRAARRLRQRTRRLLLNKDLPL